MQPLRLLKRLAKIALKNAGNQFGFGLGDMAVEVWAEWNRDGDEADHKAELQQLVQMQAEEFRKQVQAIVAEAAFGQPAAVQEQLSAHLEQVQDVVRQSFRRPEDPQGRSVPPGFRLKQANDLVPLLSKTRPGPRVTLKFTQGDMAGKQIECGEPTVLILGRAKDCQPKFPKEGHERISRHHCLVEINPPDVRIRDLGSLHGTYVNDQLLPGKRQAGTQPGKIHDSPEKDLTHGATVRLSDKGQVAFQVDVVGVAPGLRGSVGSDIKTCSWCQREVTTERGANRPGLFVCSACRQNLQGMMQELLGQAQKASPELRAIRGYDLLKELGHGGMGAVYLARHQDTGKMAAIKMMLPQVAADDRAVELFQREIRNTMALSHPHIVQLLDHGYAQATFFMVLEYCDGGSVDRLMAQRGGVLPVDEALAITLQALDGLHYAHRADIPFVKQKGGSFAPGKGVVHRDLKPANIFLASAGNGAGNGRLAKLGDYGLAKAFDETGLSGGTRTGEVAGTWQFMARPQVVDCKRVGPEVDVWALAASLYYMLTGQVPRAFPEDQDPWLVILERACEPILKHNPGLPAKLAQVIDLALAEEPDLHFKSAAQFKHALTAALSG